MPSHAHFVEAKPHGAPCGRTDETSTHTPQESHGFGGGDLGGSVGSLKDTAWMGQRHPAPVDRC